MKHLYILVIIGALAVFGATQLQTGRAEAPARRVPGVVVITGHEVYPQDGKFFIEVFAVSSGSNSPSINNHADLGETLEWLRTLGYRVTPMAGYLSFYCEKD